MRKFFILLILLFSASVFPQSRRVAPGSTPVATSSVEPANTQTVKQMFDEANAYSKAKFAAFEDKKIPFSESLRKRTQLEQKQLAAKYAGMAGLRKDLAGEDLYYLGMLHWIAENLDGTSDALRKFLASENASPERRQTARSIIVVVAAKQKNFEEAEGQLGVYLKESPAKLTERTRMESELAKAYLENKNFEKAASHAGEAYSSMKMIVSDPTGRVRGLNELLDDGMILFEAYKSDGRQKEADAALEDMRVTAATLGSSPLYYYALDNQIKYMIETGRKPLALETYNLSPDRITRDFTAKTLQTDALRRLKKREKHYKMLGETAPELEGVDQWFPGQKTTFADMRGKVILLDFWATWCVPCLEAFPSIKEWNEDFKADGLVILGVTRYYGTAEGLTVDNQHEIDFFKRFKKSRDLAYDFVVAKDTTTQRQYAATTLPTSVLIDRKGVIRYIETGTSPTRLDEIHEMIVKLLAEK